MNKRIILAACMILGVCPGASQGEVWNFADDFSMTQNPNGAWSFGWRTAANQPLTIYADQGTQCNVTEGWLYFIADYCPSVYHNPHDYPVTCLTMTMQPHQAGFSPGPAQQSVVRWTAPGPQTAHLTVHFESLDWGTRRVYVYVNGSQKFTTILNSDGQTADYSTTMAVQTGDVVDCAIAPLPLHYYNSTALEFVVETSGVVTGACCLPSGECLVGTKADCASSGGTYMGDGIACGPNPCGLTAAENMTWGRVKSLFR